MFSVASSIAEQSGCTKLGYPRSIEQRPGQFRGRNNDELVLFALESDQIGNPTLFDVSRVVTLLFLAFLSPLLSSSSRPSFLFIVTLLSLHPHFLLPLTSHPNLIAIRPLAQDDQRHRRTPGGCVEPQQGQAPGFP